MEKLKKLQSSTLLYTVLVAFIIFIILLSFVQISYISTKFLDREILKDKLSSNIRSSIEILLKRKEFLLQEELDLYGDGNSKVFIKVEFHGAYQILKLSSSISNIKLEKKYLIGATGELDNFAIILPERNNEITLSGKTVIKGNCILPKLGVKQGMVNGISFIGDQLIDGNLTKSSSSIPSHNKRLNAQEVEYLKNDSILIYSDIEDNSEIVRRFNEEKLIIYSPERILINNQLILGNIILISDKGIRIKKEAGLKDVVLIAPYVHIEKEHKGNFQVFVTDSVILEENVQLNYPSFIGVIPKNSQTEAKIELKQNSLVAGSILGLDRTKTSIGENAKVFGTVYNQGNIELKGKVFGTIIAERFTLKTGLNEKRDVIQNGEVNIYKRPSLLANAFLLENYQSIKLIKELE